MFLIIKSCSRSFTFESSLNLALLIHSFHYLTFNLPHPIEAKNVEQMCVGKCYNYLTNMCYDLLII
jgi:hypothetical protein